MSNSDRFLVYNRLEKAIELMVQQHARSIDWADVAASVDLSQADFEQLFAYWAGVSPATFGAHLRLAGSRAKHGLKDVQQGAGSLVSRPRMDLHVTIEAMTPGEYDAGLQISLACYPTLFGPVVLASTAKGICYLSFTEMNSEDVRAFKSEFSEARWVQQSERLHLAAVDVINHVSTGEMALPLHMKGTPFQLKVWNALLQLEAGELVSYQTIATTVGLPTATRAVGSAIARNPVSILVPCHRVVQASGAFGQYRWSSVRKAALIGLESVMIENNPLADSP
jgi:AraC family transcriptional regulator of adaptative response/methylated-DNA-[protein]-cysteine methyltransferase